MLKVTKKEMKAFAELTKAKKIINTNCYTFDNDLNAIKKLEISSKNSECVNNLIKEIRGSFPQAVECISFDVMYTCGTYGNNGRLVELYFINDKGEWERHSLFIYFC